MPKKCVLILVFTWDLIYTGSCLPGAPLWLLHKHRSAPSSSGLNGEPAGLETICTSGWSSEKATGLALLRAARQLLSDTQQTPSAPLSPRRRGQSSGGAAPRLNSAPISTLRSIRHAVFKVQSHLASALRNTAVCSAGLLLMIQALMDANIWWSSEQLVITDQHEITGILQQFLT